MKKYLCFAVFSSLFLSILLVGCNGTANDNENNSEVTGDSQTSVDDSGLYETQEEREINVAELPTLEVGDIIDFDEYIMIIPGDNESYSEKNDLSYTIEYMEGSTTIFERVTTTFTDTNSFKAVATGTGAFLVTSHQVTKIIYVSVTEDSGDLSEEIIQEIVDTFADVDYTDYTVTKAFTINEEFETEESTEEPCFYRTDNYSYSVEDQQGYILNNDEFLAFDLEDSTNESSFYPHLYEDSSDRITTTAYNNYFRAFSRIFTASNITYNSTVAEQFGEEYAYGINTNNSNFTYLLNNLGLSSTTSLYGYTMTLFHISPTFENGIIGFNVFVRNSSYRAYARLGPYTLKNVGTTSIEVLDNLVQKGISSSTISSDDLAYINTFSSYKSTVSGRYINKDGSSYEVPDYFEMYLPSNLDLALEVTADSLSFSNFEYVEKGVTGEVTLALSESDGLFHKYSSDGTDEGVYYYNNESFSDYLSVDAFSYYDIGSVFTSSNFQNVLFYVGEDSTYRGTTYLNDSLVNLLEVFIPFTSTYRILRSDGPFYYYLVGLSNTKVNLTIGNGIFSGSILTPMIDNGETFYYEYKFNVTLGND